MLPQDHEIGRGIPNPQQGSITTNFNSDRFTCNRQSGSPLRQGLPSPDPALERGTTRLSTTRPAWTWIRGMRSLGTSAFGVIHPTPFDSGNVVVHWRPCRPKVQTATRGLGLTELKTHPQLLSLSAEIPGRIMAIFTYFSLGREDFPVASDPLRALFSCPTIRFATERASSPVGTRRCPLSCRIRTPWHATSMTIGGRRARPTSPRTQIVAWLSSTGMAQTIHLTPRSKFVLQIYGARMTTNAVTG